MIAVAARLEVRRRLSCGPLILVLFTGGVPRAQAQEQSTLLPAIRPNDNRVAAGHTSSNSVAVTLTARLARWYPDGDRRPAPLLVPAFAEGDEAPSIPGPLIRVRAGTRVRVTLRNAFDGRLAGFPLVVHGLYRRPAAVGESERIAPIRVPPGATREVEFDAGEPGTYYYWGAFSDTTRVEKRDGIEAALGGVIVVDPKQGSVAADRVFMISLMGIPPEGHGNTRQPQRFAVAVNGLSWPLTEQLDAAVGDTLRWRWVNPTAEHHPIHLHGFYYHVLALGDERTDTAYSYAKQKLVVTQRMDEGGTMSLTWIPERAGNWLVHCHLRQHSGPDPDWGFLDVPGTGTFGASFATTGSTLAPAGHSASPAAVYAVHDMERDMAGLIIGIRVRPAREGVGARLTVPLAPRASRARHEVRLTVSPQRGANNATAQLTLRVEDPRGESNGRTSQSTGVGPPIVLRRNEPSRITVVNRLSEATALHWHGIELESYYDGVAGWGGGPGGGMTDGRRSPAIAPGDSFAVLLTPPRAGTFIYHSHALTTSQMGAGLYGPLIVLDSGETIDSTREVAWIVGGRAQGEGDAAFLLLNGARAPAPKFLVAGRRYHVRVINIAENVTADIALLDGDGAAAQPAEWREVAKDAVPFLKTLDTMRPARLRTSVGETYDFELVRSLPGVLRLEVRNEGDLMVEQRLIVR